MLAEGDKAEFLSQTLVMILAGGQGERLYPLTRDRAKPAVPFAGSYRLIDFTLSNCLNSGLRRIHVLTQYKSDSLNRHIRLGWDLFNPVLGEYVEIRPPQQRLTSHWYLGTADAVHQNIYTLERERPRYVLLLGSDHVYKMDYSRMLRRHLENSADLTVACIEAPVAEAVRLGVVTVDDEMRVIAFQEKPSAPQPLRRGGDRALCSMGIYVFNTEFLVRRVIEDSKEATRHDLGGDLLPSMVRRSDRVFAFGLLDESPRRAPYWRDIGTIDAYWDASMDLTRPQPSFDLYDPRWPLRTYSWSLPPARVVLSGRATEGLTPQLRDSLVCDGAVVRQACVRNSIIGRNVLVDSGSRVEDSVILDDVRLGRGVTVRKAIIDKGNRVPDGFAIGVDPDQDARLFTVSPGGVVVVPKEMPLFRS